MKKGWIILAIVNLLVGLFATPYVVMLGMAQMIVVGFYLSMKYEKVHKI